MAGCRIALWLNPFLTEVGDITEESRQQLIPAPDVPGLSMLATALNNAKPAGRIESKVFGPNQALSRSRAATGTVRWLWIGG